MVAESTLKSQASAVSEPDVQSAPANELKVSAPVSSLSLVPRKVKKSQRLPNFRQFKPAKATAPPRVDLSASPCPDNHPAGDTLQLLR